MKIQALFFVAVILWSSRGASQTIQELNAAQVGRGILGTGATVNFIQGIGQAQANHLEPFWIALMNASGDLEYQFLGMPDAVKGIELAASDKDKIEGLIGAAEKEAKKNSRQ